MQFSWPYQKQIPCGEVVFFIFDPVEASFLQSQNKFRRVVPMRGIGIQFPGRYYGDFLDIAKSDDFMLKITHTYPPAIPMLAKIRQKSTINQL